MLEIIFGFLIIVLFLYAVYLLITIIISENHNPRIYFFKVIPKADETAWYITAGYIKWNKRHKTSIITCIDGIKLNNIENSFIYLPYEIAFKNQFKSTQDVMSYCFDIYSSLCKAETANSSLTPEQEDDE